MIRSESYLIFGSLAFISPSHPDQVPVAGAYQSGSVALYQPIGYGIAGRELIRNRISS